ncbi:hypothetical protein BDQ12DRAFT_773402 [Crucibulum laeve]|uniref:PHD-type domain-containing protein n=1 Tax=Crucibulum laeve TaxID=68775 RepID=A0A5C3LIJ4_9AGAR|nr:hypothetical protein BDQ12DRAFT_773402 [Crucibulum laeve]
MLGHLVQYVERPEEEGKGKLPNVVVKPKKLLINEEEKILYTRTSDGQYIPLASSATTQIPKPLPDTTKCTSTKDVIINSDTWDGWPDGIFDQDFTFKQMKETSNLRVHWAVGTSGGDRKGSEHSIDWEGGKRTSRKCLGVIECDNPTCQIITRPHVKSQRIASQLEKSCRCGAKLFRQECNVPSHLWTWSGGVHYSNKGHHTHRRPTHLLHLFPREKYQFEELVKSHPTSGPLQLIVGVPGLDGPGDSAADISEVLLNAHRVSKERQKIKRGGNSQTIDGLIAAFAKFDSDHPNFVLQSTFGAETVISVQTSFMRSQMVKKERLDGAINGLVNDAAHGWWTERNSLLMLSSTYCPVLQCWVPGIMTYTNGAKAESRNIPVMDELFAGMMDFSEAERSGFVRGFITFWMQRAENIRTRQELQVKAERLLKGCREHYRAGVTRVSRMHAAVPPDMANEFKKRVLALLDLADSGEFLTQARLIVRDFPNLKAWMEWWMRPSHAQMLFESERKMDINLWKSIPMTNNPEESMHWKLYSACGHNHLFLEGMYSLYKVAIYYERLYDASARQLIRYGKAEHWKVIAEKSGHSKPSRSDNPENKKRKKNDGHPPDTVKELIKTGKKKKQATEKPASDGQLINGVPTLAILTLPCNHNMLDSKEPNITQMLGHQRDGLRKMLVGKKIIKRTSSFESLWVWFYELMAQDDAKTSYRPIALFEVLFSEIRTCSGFIGTGGCHIEIPNPLMRRRIHQIGIDAHEEFNGSFSDYFADMISIEKKPTPAVACWRIHEGATICSGTRKDYRFLVTSLPILYSVEIASEAKPSLIWDFPATLVLDTKTAAKNSGLIYDLVGYALTNLGRDHWTARFASNNKMKIFTYDGMENNGFSIQEPNATFNTHMLGVDMSLPTGFSIYQVFYILRGGVKAQDLFFKSRTKTLSKRFNIGFSEKSLDKLSTVTYNAAGFVRMHPKDRFWLRSPHNAPQQTANASDFEPESEEEMLLKPTAIPLLPPPPPSKSVIEIPSTPSQSLPDSLFNLNCRCGTAGDGNMLYDPKVHGEAIQCDECKDWSHIACQREGRASNLGKKDSFICDHCNVSHLLRTRRQPERGSKKKQMEERTRIKKPLEDRLWSGRGALALNGEYWYPVHLIHKELDQWNVRWWRDNIFLNNDILPGQTSLVKVADLVDSLWMDRKTRRKIQLGKWKHAHEVDTVEDILADPSSIPYSKCVDEILSPHRLVLKKLLTPDSIDKPEQAIPAKKFLKKAKKSPTTTKIPYVGSLSVIERAQISNWFEHHIMDNNKKLRRFWLGLLPIAHAHTIYISAHLQPNPKYQSLNEEERLEEAWKFQLSAVPSLDTDVDVERESLERLEEEMFEVSVRAGVAGNYQWGLDAGQHQDWNPYCDLPEHWNHGDREGSDGELEYGPDFITNPPLPPIEKKTRPKPRPKGGKMK